MPRDYGPVVAEFKSHSKPDKVYQVHLTPDGRFTCNCPSWVFNQLGRECRHTLKVQLARVTAGQSGANRPARAEDTGASYKRKLILDDD